MINLQVVIELRLPDKSRPEQTIRDQEALYKGIREQLEVMGYGDAYVDIRVWS